MVFVMYYCVTGALLFIQHIILTSQCTYYVRFCTQRQRKLYLPYHICQTIAQRPGKAIIKRRVRQDRSLRKYHPITQLNKHPADQYTLDFDNKVALIYPGLIQVIYEAERGKQMPIPTPQKNRVIRNDQQFQQMQESRPKIVCIIVSHNINEQRPYLSEQTCKYDPKDTPKQTVVINIDCSKVVKVHSKVKIGSSNPRTTVSHPQLKRSKYRARLNFY